MKKKLWLIPVAGLFVAAFILSIFYDLEVSNAVFVKNNLFGIIMASIGELPMYGGVAFAGGALVSATKKRGKSVLGLIISIIVALGATGFGLYFMGNAFCSVNAWGSIFPAVLGNKVMAFAVGAVLVLPCLALGLFTAKNDDTNGVLLAAIEILLVGFLQIGLITVLKGVFHRPRFRSLSEAGVAF